jgi:hypothetical protein
MKYHVTSLLVSGEADSLSTLVTVVCEQTMCRDNLAALWRNEYPLALVKCVCGKPETQNACFYGLWRHLHNEQLKPAYFTVCNQQREVQRIVT